MKPSNLIPMFPLTLLPLPGELVPLHIFEPRYKELLQDAEANDIHFGIYFNHEMNLSKFGSLMRLESVLKRYRSGEADIIVKCTEAFQMEKLYRTYKNKLYPGGDVRTWESSSNQIPSQELYELFLQYLTLRNISERYTMFSVCQIAHELSLDLQDRYKFLDASGKKRESFLSTRLKFQIHLLQQEERAKDVFHLN
jgi:Lon protease-like protein